MRDLPDPISRRDRQNRTRKAIIIAARAAFSELGYHGARLDEIARAAGFSKGAVYSNFANKAELFLAVMDHDIEEVLLNNRELDLFRREHMDVLADDEDARMAKGFSLASMEFVTVALRDQGLAAEVAERFNVMRTAYASVVGAVRQQRAAGAPAADAAEDGTGGEELSDKQIGMLMAALDQGMGLVAMISGGVPEPGLWLAGMLRLSGLAESDLQGAAGGGDAIPQARVIREALSRMDAAREADPEAGD